MHFSPKMLAVLLCAVSILFLPSANAQSTNASLSGQVTDVQGLVVAGAEVDAVNQATNVVYSTKTNGEGIYSLPELPPGTYEVHILKDGFRTLLRPGIELHVQDARALNATLQVGDKAEIVRVEGGIPPINTENAAVSTVIDRNFVESLPLNGRSFNTLLQLTPGVVIAMAPALGQTSPGQFSIAGQRADANSFTVDGVSADFGVGVLGTSGVGTTQAFSALGGTSSLVSVDALQEFRIETSSFAPEFGRTPGGQVILTTRAGTNGFHGDVFEYFRNTVMDANDWFANSIGNPRAPEHHNDFGGVLGGPIWRSKTFFFFSYEGARLRLPSTLPTQVPSEWARTVAAPPALAPYLNAYPQPNDKTVTPNVYISPFIGSWSNAATLDATSVRIDHTFNQHFSMFGRYNHAPSETTSRAPGGVLSVLNTLPVNTQTLTVGANVLLRHEALNALRANYSTQTANSVYALDSFGGAVPVNPSLLLGSLSSTDNVGSFETFDTGTYSTGPQQRNRTRQLNVVDDLSVSVRTHQLKFGGDYRAIFLDNLLAKYGVQPSAMTVQNFLTPPAGTVQLTVKGTLPAHILTQSSSFYGQDTWKIMSRLTLTYGLRWELNPAPSAEDKTVLASWTNVNTPSQIALAPSGTPLWSTTYTNFAPRIGLAYSPTAKGDFVIRGGWGIFYDLGLGSVSILATDFPNLASNFVPNVTLPVSDFTPYLPSFSTQPPYSFFVQGFSPNLTLPRSYQWNVALEKSFSGRQAMSATYVAQRGRNLLRNTSEFQPNSNFLSDFQLTVNGARSNYDALQLQYRRTVSAGLRALLNYTWSHSLDNASNDVVAGLSNTVISGANDYASSDFDVRHTFSGALTYDLPSPKSGVLSAMSKDWSLDSVIVARSGFPFNATIFSTSPDPGGTAFSRPDRVSGQPYWIGNPQAPGGKMLNVKYDPVTGAITGGAFAIPSTVRQGSEGRNDIPGFGLTQIDLSIARKFVLTERFALKFRADAFNVLNHPNFTNPIGLVEFGQFAPTVLKASQMANVGLGGLNPLFQEGGPRSLQLSLKFSF